MFCWSPRARGHQGDDGLGAFLSLIILENLPVLPPSLKTINKTKIAILTFVLDKDICSQYLRPLVPLNDPLRSDPLLIASLADDSTAKFVGAVITNYHKRGDFKKKTTQKLISSQVWRAEV